MIQHITSMFRKLSAQLMTAIVINMLLSPAIAEVISQPAGLMPGDQYRLFFMTSGERDATSTDIEDYDAFVQHHADRSPVLAALGLNWKAVVSTPTVAARDNTGTNPEVDGDGVPIYLINGELLGRHNSGLWEHEISPSMHVNEFGDFTPSDEDPILDGVLVWTGLLAGRTPGPGEAFQPLGTSRPAIGQATTGGLIGFTTASSEAANQHHMYAMSPVITVPEPVRSDLLLFLSLLGFTRIRRK